MVVLIDTNIILDILEKRAPFYEASSQVLSFCATGKIKGYIALHSISNIFYILRKHFSAEDRRKLLLGILDFLQIANASHEDVKRALARDDFPDFEDCLQDECAKRVSADYVITRNISDFSTSNVPAIAPANFIETLKGTYSSLSNEPKE